jgi:hypothetical protein
MRVSDIQAGRNYIVEVEQGDRELFNAQEFLAVKNEVFLYRSEVTNEILLRHSSEVWEIRGTDRQNQTSLENILERNLPILCWLTATLPKGQAPLQLLIQVQEFPGRLLIPDEMQIGIDEKIIEDIRSRHLRRNEPIEAIIEWLNGQVILPQTSDLGMVRALMRAGKSSQDGLETTFQLCGSDFTIDVRRDTEGRLRVERIVKAKQKKEFDEQRPLVILEAKLSFCDFSIAGTLRFESRTELDAIARNADSYLSLWREYNELEQQGILRRVQQFSWVAYSSQEMLANGDRRFYLESQADLEERLQLLRDLSEDSLEASDTEPDLTSFENVKTDNAKTRQKAFFGKVMGVDFQNYTLDIRPPDPDELLSPPPKGFLFVSLQGDRTRLKRRKRAEERIRTATCPMPQLGLILENRRVTVSKYRKHKPLSKTTRNLFNGSPTPRQEEALQVAINTPDIALIQGPPGTGKTKVITALQARLAEISEDSDVGVSHRLLLTSYQHDAVENAAERTVVFGLPAVRIGGRANRSDAPDNVDRWRRDRMKALEAKLSQLPDLPETDQLRQVQNLVAGYVLTPSNSQQTAKLLEKIYQLTKGRIPGELSDRLLEQKHHLSVGNSSANLADTDTRDLAIRAVRSLRTEAILFSDDGPTTAYKALRRLESLNLLSDDDRCLLETTADWDNSESPGTEPPFLNDLAVLQTRLLDQLIPVDIPATTVTSANPEIEELLQQVREALYEKIRQSGSGIEAVLEEYLNDLKYDPDGVREMLRDYTVVLAATCQQAVGKQMELTTGNIDSVFETVIVDEAARANPLDLFIPMSKAERRIILVGDHRQLPQILDEDVERELSVSTEATQAALKKSLFERLFKQLQAWEKIDGIKRTVTLDTQYRMHPVLGEFVSRTFYEYHGESPIKAGRAETEFFHDLPGYEQKVAAWIDIPHNLGGEYKRQSKSRQVEALRIAKELRRLIEHDPHLTFGVITFYRAQVTELWKALCNVGLAEVSDDGSFQVAPAWRETTNHEGKLVERLRVGTVDAFQGKEFDVVFLSMTRSNRIVANSPETYTKKYGFLLLENRLCVAMSRQQRLLIVAGDLEMVKVEVNKPESDRQVIRELIAFFELCQTSLGKIL